MNINVYLLYEKCWCFVNLNGSFLSKIRYHNKKPINNILL